MRTAWERGGIAAVILAAYVAGGIAVVELPERWTDEVATVDELEDEYKKELGLKDLTFQSLVDLNAASETARAQQVDGLRRLGASFLAATFVVAGLYLNYRRTRHLEAQVESTRAGVELTRGQLELTRQQLAATEKGQLVDRFTKAVEQLGHEAADIRFGGLYALEGVAREAASRDNAGLDPQVPLQVIAAFVRRPRMVRDQPVVHDVQIALDILGRSKTYLPNQAHDLTGADLSGANLKKANFERADLSGANLKKAILNDANLSGAILNGAKLNEAVLGGTQLYAATLHGADLTDALLSAANLKNAYFGEANLTRAVLLGAYATGANFSQADLTDAVLQACIADDTTQWPHAWPNAWDGEQAKARGVSFVDCRPNIDISGAPLPPTRQESEHQ